MPSIFLKKLSFLAATVAFALFGLTGCDAVTSPEAGPSETVDKPSKMRHAHLYAYNDGTGKLVQRYEDLVTHTEFIVAADETVLDINRLVQRYAEEEGVTIKRTYKKAFRGFAMHVDEANVPDVLDLLDGDDEVAWVEPDIHINRGHPNSTGITANNEQWMPWNVDEVEADLSYTRAGDGQGSVDGVDVFILDTGISNNDINVVSQVLFHPNASIHDQLGHGTHVAGTVAAIDDGNGAVGVAPGVRIHDYKVLDDNGQSELSTVIDAVEQITKLKLNDPSQPMVVNISFGADIGTPKHNALDEAIQASIEAGVIYVIAAGNEGIDARFVTPAHVPEAITVGAYDQNDVFASFSNYGPFVDLFAPGVDVVSLNSTKMGSPYALIEMSGTSMAAPHVTGAVALYLSQNPSANFAQVRNALLDDSRSSVRSVPSETTDLSACVGDFGNGKRSSNCGGKDKGSK